MGANDPYIIRSSGRFILNISFSFIINPVDFTAIQSTLVKYKSLTHTRKKKNLIKNNNNQERKYFKTLKMVPDLDHSPDTSLAILAH